MKCQDEVIVELILKHDQRSDYQAVKCLSKCKGQISSVLIRMNSAEADERESVFNHALVAFIMNVRNGKFQLSDVAKICTYLTETAKRIWLNWQRETKIKNMEQPIEENGPDPDLRERLKNALCRLAPSDQEILTAFYFYDLTLEDYAGRKNISHDAAKQRISRARTRLKELFIKN